MGVLIDDLITQGTREPYRMFTSRAEYRLNLREDNADIRLTEKGREMGLVSDSRWDIFKRKREAVAREQERLGAIWLRPDNDLGTALNRAHDISLSRESTALDLLKRPELDYVALMQVKGIGPGVLDKRVAEQVEVQVKYAGYLKRQFEEIKRNRRNEGKAIPADIDYLSIRGLSAEAREKLQQMRPETIGQASRIQGMTPAAISLLRVHLKKQASKRKVA